MCMLCETIDREHITGSEDPNPSEAVLTLVHLAALAEDLTRDFEAGVHALAQTDREGMVRMMAIRAKEQATYAPAPPLPDFLSMLRDTLNGGETIPNGGAPRAMTMDAGELEDGYGFGQYL